MAANYNELKIRIEDRIFSLNLSNLSDSCRNSVEQIFCNKEYRLEELLVDFVKLICEKRMAQMELLEILNKLES